MRGPRIIANNNAAGRTNIYIIYNYLAGRYYVISVSGSDNTKENRPAVESIG